MTVSETRTNHPALGWATFLLIAISGLFYVKWFPYYNRMFVAATHHAIGSSILMGKSADPPSASLGAAIEYAVLYGRAIWKAMVLGLVLGSAVQTLLPMQWVAKALGKMGFSSVAAGGLLAVPGMMCTCCAAPIVIGLSARRASPGGAIAFWLGNSVLNPATLVFMGFVLGWNWVALRLVLGTLMVFGVGYAVNRMAAPAEMPIAPAKHEDLAVNTPDAGVFRRWLSTLGRMSLRLVPEYAIIVLLLGATRAWLFPHIGPEIGNSLVWIVALALAGTLFVIPTAGEVPIVQAMLSLGMGVGPAGALIMTLPPISAPSLAMVVRSFRMPVLAVVVGATVTFGVVGGVIAVWLRF